MLVFGSIQATVDGEGGHQWQQEGNQQWWWAPVAGQPAVVGILYFIVYIIVLSRRCGG